MAKLIHLLAFKPRCPQLVSALFGSLLGCLLMASALAGVITREELVKHFPTPYIVGEKEQPTPVWPIYRQDATENRLVGYAFESIDLAPIPGFAGVPFNLLITLDPKGNFLDVAVLSQHEPVFVDGLGEGPLVSFVDQYKGLSLKQNMRIVTGTHGAKNDTAESAQLDGITKATASVHIINQTVLSSALRVARKKLGFAEGRDPELMARIKPDFLESRTFQELSASGLLGHIILKNADIEKSFAATIGRGLDSDSLAHPQDTFIDLTIAYISVPSIGRSLLRERAWKKLQDRLGAGDQAILAMWKGRYDIISESFVRGSTSDRLVLKQDKFPIEMRDLNLDLELKSDPGLDTNVKAAVFKISSQAGLDPAIPLDFVLPITRYKGIVFPDKVTRNFTFSFDLPPRFYTIPEGDHKSWAGMWYNKWREIFVLVVGLAILSIALALQKRLVSNEGRFAAFRNTYLLFTLFFIGWYAQGQLSIVNLTGLLQALASWRGLGYLLYDPVTVILLVFVCISLLLWGRGTFCGWLCPFGALQEFVAKIGQQLKIPQLPIKATTDSRLKLIKYVVLAAILLSALISTRTTDLIVEVEPFKTAITLAFVRSWPFVAYAVVLLVANLFVYKLFCRYLCPFGAGLAALGRVRQLDWIPRRSECGKPCQICSRKCEYQAITPDGRIQYDECFQCMDCLIIYASDKKCAPLMLEKKRARVIRIADSAKT